MFQKNIALFGFMGSGKSVTARKLAARLKRPCVSTDALIEERAGRTIREIFETDGEAKFRELEKAVVAAVAGREGVVIDCGGGVILDPDNRAALRRGAFTVYLKASPEFLFRNIEGKQHRPLLNVGDPMAVIRSKLKEREPLYAQADHTLAVEGMTVAGIVKNILERIKTA